MLANNLRQLCDQDPGLQKILHNLDWRGAEIEEKDVVEEGTQNINPPARGSQAKQGLVNAAFPPERKSGLQPNSCVLAEGKEIKRIHEMFIQEPSFPRKIKQRKY